MPKITENDDERTKVTEKLVAAVARVEKDLNSAVCQMTFHVTDGNKITPGNSD